MEPAAIAFVSLFTCTGLGTCIFYIKNRFCENNASCSQAQNIAPISDTVTTQQPISLVFLNQALPSYEEATKHSSREAQPPSYEQVMRNRSSARY